VSAISFALAGLNRAEDQLNGAAVTIAGAGASTSPDAPVDSVDLSSAMVSLIQARNNTAANVQVVHVVDEMQKSILNLLG
jgi:flagellar hook protein FlgE